MVTDLRLPLWPEVLLAISNSDERNRYSENIRRQMKASRSYLGRVVKKLAQNNLVIINHGNRTKRLTITDQGRRVSEALQQLKWSLSGSASYSQSK